jgi:RNA polymerase sigma-70 factor (ECF subfamily)
MVDELSLHRLPHPESSGGTTTVTRDFASVYRAEMGPLIRFVMKHGARPQEAADAAQEAFVQAYKAWETISFPERWLRTVAPRIYFRAALKVKEDLPGEICSSPGDCHLLTDIELSDQERSVFAALAELTGRQRQVMAWYYDGYDTREIAEVLEISEAAVRQNLHRARKQLKAHRIQRGGA